MSSYLGQNFLIDDKYIKIIIEKLKQFDVFYDTIFEIGPGKGALTKPLINLNKQLFLFEKDLLFTNILEKIQKKSNILYGDILDLNIKTFVDNNNLNLTKVFIVGNLPYYITSPILKKFFWDFNNINYGLFMIQKEVGEKLQTKSSKKSFLWWLLNYSYNIEIIEYVPAKAFNPAPKVDSCIVLLQKKDQEAVNKEDLLKFISLVNKFKRKTLGKIFKIVGTNDYYLSEDLINKRIEELSWQNIYKILNNK